MNETTRDLIALNNLGGKMQRRLTQLPQSLDANDYVVAALSVGAIEAYADAMVEICKSLGPHIRGEDWDHFEKGKKK